MLEEVDFTKVPRGHITITITAPPLSSSAADAPCSVACDAVVVAAATDR
jgi:hypothetical protein